LVFSLIDLRALFSAWRIFLSSSSFSAISLDSYTPINPAQLPRQDLIDTYNLSRNYLDHKIVDLKSDLLSEQDSLSKNFRDESSIKFKSGGNRIQFKFNEGIQCGVQQLVCVPVPILYL
jgi:hypothetical protein